MSSIRNNDVRINRSVLIAIIATVSIAALAGLWLYSDLWLGTYLANFVHQYAVPLGTVALGLVLGAVLIVIAERTDHGGWAAAALVAAAAGVVGGIFLGWYGSYLEEKKVAQMSASSTTDGHDTFAERPSFDQVKRIIDGDKGDLRGDVSDVRRVGDQSQYTALVKDTKFAAQGGYTGLLVREDDETDARQCAVPEDANLRIGGWFNGSLEREISHIERRLVIDEGDAYGLCDGDTVKVIVPVKRQQGFFPVIEVPAGVVVYDTSNGDLEYIENVEAGEIAGPVYPMSLAAYQREALKAHGYNPGLMDWARGRVGYTLSKEDGDPNGSNPSEIQLTTTDGRGAYVSPMAVRSKSGSTRIAAMADVNSGVVKAGEFNDIVLHTYESEGRRPTNAVVSDSLRASYQDLQGWANGLTIFEIVPTADREWVATLGYERTVTFRVRIDAQGNTTLEDPSGRVIEKRDANGSLLEGASDPDAGDDVIVGDGGLKLSELSDRELAELLAQVSDEVLSRATAETKKKN